MEELCDQLLVDSYVKAIQMNLDKDFIRLLHEEVRKRDSAYRLIPIKYQEKINESG